MAAKKSPAVKSKPIEPQKKIRRRRGEGSEEGRELRMYFNKDTQAAIVEYQNCPVEDKKKRETIYITRILPAYQKLSENLINIHKFTSLYDSYDDLKNDCVNFLFETIYKFDESRGSNAFSYFNVVAKNWLIIKTKQKTTKIKKNVSFDDQSALTANDLNTLDEWNTTPSQEFMIENKCSADTIIEMLHDMRDKVKTDCEKTCVNAIIAVFENIEDIDLLNKTAVLLYMRELSGLSPKQLTMTMQTLKKNYRRMKDDPKYRL